MTNKEAGGVKIDLPGVWMAGVGGLQRVALAGPGSKPQKMRSGAQGRGGGYNCKQRLAY